MTGYEVAGLTVLAGLVLLLAGLLRAAGRVPPVAATVEQQLIAGTASWGNFDPWFEPVMWCFRCGGNEPGKVHRRTNAATWWCCGMCGLNRDVTNEELPI